MPEGGMHWAVSATAGFVLTGQYRPICSFSFDWPDCRPRRRFHDAMNWVFPPVAPQIGSHCLHIHAVWLLGIAARAWARS